MSSVVMICPILDAPEWNDVLDSMGFGPGTFGVPLSASGSDPATHSGTHLWETIDSPFYAFRLALDGGIVVPELTGREELIARLRYRVEEGVRPGNGGDEENWTTALSDAGLIHIVGKLP